MIKLIGGKGFVGSKLAAECKGSQILDIKINKETSNNSEKFIDIRNPESIKGSISKEDIIVLLAAEHRDDVSPISKYYKTNVTGTQNILQEMDRVGCKHLIFTSSVAVYGLNKKDPDESHSVDPFNHYGKSKWEAERIIKSWFDKDPKDKKVTIIRPTVIFGEKNRGNVYNLLNQIASGKFLMIGKGQNRKSMAYVGNVVAFIQYRIKLTEEGFHIFNYVDKPDLTMTLLLEVVAKYLNKKLPSIRIPFWLGYLIGVGFDLVAFITRRKLAISSVRVKKFVATTQFNATKVHSSGFKAPYTLEEGLSRTLKYEFVEKRSKEDEIFYTE